MWKGTVEGEDTKKRWTGEVELFIEGSTVRGSIKWVSGDGVPGEDYSGIEKVEGKLDGDGLDLHGAGIRNDKGFKALATTKRYLGMFTKQGRICFKWFPKNSNVPKGAASGKLEQVSVK